MSVGTVLQQASVAARGHGVGAGVQTGVAEAVAGGLQRVEEWLPARGRHVYDHDWDVLVVLDTCRADALQAVADGYPWLPDDPGTTWSLASKTKLWFRWTFRPDIYPQHRQAFNATYLATFNPNSTHLHPHGVGVRRELWRDCWNEERKGVPPAEVTAASLQAVEDGYDRVICHLKEPHAPYESLGIPFADLRAGRLDRDTVWSAYLDELRRGLDATGDLLAALDDERVVVTADHGDCFGEWGLYGHHCPAPLPELREVPWVEIDAATVG